jgi:cytoskeletal protein RodZ
VAANDLIVGCVGWNDPSPSAGYATSVSGVSDGTSSFTLGTQTATTTTTPDRGQCFYLLAANSGSRTYTITFTNTNAVYTSLNTQLVFTEFSASGKTWHYDAANQNNSGSTTSTAWNSGTITTQTTYPGEAVVAFSRLFNVGATLSNILIGSYTPIEYQTATYLLNLPLAAAGGTATYSASTNWVGMITAFYAR